MCCRSGKAWYLVLTACNCASFFSYLTYRGFAQELLLPLLPRVFGHGDPFRMKVFWGGFYSLSSTSNISSLSCPKHISTLAYVPSLPQRHPTSWSFSFFKRFRFWLKKRRKWNKSLLILQNSWTFTIWLRCHFFASKPLMEHYNRKWMQASC